MLIKLKSRHYVGGTSAFDQPAGRATHCGWVLKRVLNVGLPKEHVAAANPPQHPLESRNPLSTDHPSNKPSERAAVNYLWGLHLDRSLVTFTVLQLITTSTELELEHEPFVCCAYNLYLTTFNHKF